MPQTIQNCWCKSGIFPGMPPPAAVQPTIPISSLINPSADQQEPITNAEKWVKNALDDLVSTGTLQCDNIMNIEALLNPATKAQNLDEMTDEKICQAVQDAWRAEYEVTDSGDCGSNDEAPFPTHYEALQAVSVINSTLIILMMPLPKIGGDFGFIHTSNPFRWVLQDDFYLY